MRSFAFALVVASVAADAPCASGSCGEEGTAMLQTMQPRASVGNPVRAEKDILDSLAADPHAAARQFVEASPQMQTALLRRAQKLQDGHVQQLDELPDDLRAQVLLAAARASSNTELLESTPELDEAVSNKEKDEDPVDTVDKAIQKKSRRKAKRALLIIDVQDCFLDSSCTENGEDGSLAVPACGIVPKIKDLVNDGCFFEEVIYSQDFHPAGHISYASSHGIDNWLSVYGKSVPLKCLKPTGGKDVISSADAACCPTLYIDESLVNCTSDVCPPSGRAWYEGDGAGLITDNAACTTCQDDSSKCFDTTQALWSDHCLQTGDSQINAGVAPRPQDLVVQKGTNKFVDAYSAFMDNTKNIKTKLNDRLKEKRITELYVTGIATDVCVRETVLDAFHEKTYPYTVTVINDATAPVLGNEANHNASLVEMVSAGATLKTVEEVLAMPCE